MGPALQEWPALFLRPNKQMKPQRPTKQGLYDPWFEHDSCGVGFVVDIQGRMSNRILNQAIEILKNLDHRGAAGSEANTGDGAGVPEGSLQEGSHQPAGTG